ncbi:MAG: methionine--tRNA ligase subunit beta, partial [Planctomycetota bacterium]
TVNGEKMSKSLGTFIKAETYLKHLDPQALRYFYASKLTSRVDDLDLNFEEFVNKANADLVGKIVNLASRSAKFVEASGLATAYPEDGGLFTAAAAAGEEIAAAYESCDYSRAVRLINELADRANFYIDSRKPWELRKDPTKTIEVQEACSVALNLFRQLVVYLSPILPRLAEQTGQLLNDPIRNWRQSQSPLVGTQVNKFEHLLKRIDLKDVQAMVEESAVAPETVPAATAASTPVDSDAALLAEPLAGECTIEDFQKVDLRVARILKAEHVEGANKLLRLTVSLGGENTRNVFAGIKAAYDPEKLVGRLVIVVANLKPRQMKFGLSEGMVCASGGGGTEVYLLSPDSGAVPGQRVH